MARLNIFSIAPNQPFLEVLAQRLLAQSNNPLSLSKTLVLLPSQRACLALKETFLCITDGAPMLLPRMQQLSELSEEENPLWLENAQVDGALLPPAGQPLRHMLLARLVARAGVFTQGGSLNMEQAMLLAAELMRLLDDMARAGLSFDGLEALAPEELSAHWQKTVVFLRLIEREWPKLLAAHRVMDPITRRNHQLLRLAEAWRKHPPEHPIIAAGSTGSQAATAELLAVIATLPQGAVILPGLDAGMPEEAWEALSENHPQWGMRALLARLNCPRDAVRPLESAPEAPRDGFIREVFRPSQLCDAWRTLSLDVEAATRHITLLETETPREEAQAIALTLRAALVESGTRAALITPDRELARRVRSEMQQFDITLDDSAGTPVLSTPAGIFLQLVAACAESDCAPVPLLSLLKHPLASLELGQVECRRASRLLERAVLRGYSPASGIAGLRVSLAKTKYSNEKNLTLLLNALEAALADFLRAMQSRAAPFEELLTLHLRACEALSESTETRGAKHLWAGEGGRVLAEALSEIRENASLLGAVEPQQYAAILQSLLQPRVVRETYGTHPRLMILSPMEARLQQFDLAILAGLNEGVWPKAPEASPWMSRPMQAQFGLPLPEEAVGKSAHDFAMLLHCPRVVLSRSKKSAGASTTPSRWLLRMHTLMAAVQPDVSLKPAEALHWARQIPRAAMLPLFPPAPCPPSAARPRKLSVTEIETLQRDPYQIYAKHILKLRPLDAIDEEPDASDFGNLVHLALENFTRAHPAELPKDAEVKLLDAGRAAFRTMADRPAVVAYWQPRFEAIVPWLIAKEKTRRPHITRLLSECKGTLAMENFTLTTKMDRLELHENGAFSVVDYKSGAVPSAKDIKAGISIQLALEALVVMEGGVTEATACKQLKELMYWKLAGANNEEIAVEDVTALARARLAELIAHYGQATPYLAQPDEAFAPKYNDYEHLERKEEWA